jgi:hypothetical protein
MNLNGNAMLIFIDNDNEMYTWGGSGASVNAYQNYAPPAFVPRVQEWLDLHGIVIEGWFDKGPAYLWAVQFKNDEEAMMFKLYFNDETRFENDTRSISNEAYLNLDANHPMYATPPRLYPHPCSDHRGSQ